MVEKIVSKLIKDGCWTLFDVVLVVVDAAAKCSCSFLRVSIIIVSLLREKESGEFSLDFNHNLKWSPQL